MSIQKYMSIARLSIANNLAYGIDGIISTLFIGVIMFLFCALWKVVYAYGGSIEGFTLVMVLWYLVMTEAIVTSLSEVLEDIGDEVISGNIANYLNKPYSYIAYKYFSTIGSAIFRFMMTFIISSIVVLIFIGPLHIPFWTIPFIAITAFLAITLSFMITATLAMFAFWIEDPKAMAFLYQKIVFTLGGMLLPLEFFPSWLAKISSVLPFSYIAYYPAKLFVKFDMAQFLKVIALQIMWIVIFLAVLLYIYSKYIKRLVINGG